MRIRLPNDWEPRPYQLPAWSYLENGGKRACLIWHRRSGKDDVALNWACIAGHERVGEYWHMLPEAAQGRKVIWDAVSPHTGRKRIDQAFPDILRERTREDEMTIRLKCGSLWRVVGSDNYESLLGATPAGVVFSEWALADPNAWAFLRPILMENKGWAIFITTPRGTNHAYKTLDLAKSDKAWFSQVLTVENTGIFTPEQMAAELHEYQHDYGEEEGKALFEQEYYCFKPDALVTCADKVRPIREITEGDSVLTHTGRFRRVNKLMSRLYHGPMVKIESFGSRPIVCTPEHPVRICDPTTQIYSWKAAKDVIESDWLVTPKMHIDGHGVVSANLAKVIAWYVCEGCISGNNLTFSIGRHEPEFVADLRAALAKCGYESTECNNANVTVVSVNSVVLSDFLVGQCGSHSLNKRLPLSLLRGNEQVVWETLINGDGCVHVPEGANPVYAYTTISEGLAQQVQILGASLGFTGTYTVKEGGLEKFGDGREIETHQSYCVQLRQRSTYEVRKSGKTRSAKNAALGRVRAISEEYYVGYVYNLSVQGDESYVVNTRAVHNCSFESALVGSYYGSYLARAAKDGRILSRIPIDRAILVHTAWDLGVTDSTAIWFIQRAGREYRLIDYHEGAGVGLDEYARVLDAKRQEHKWVYGNHYFPHDMAVRELGNKGKSRADSMQELGYKPTIVPQHNVMDGINATRKLLDQAWIDETRCERGLNALRNYRRAWDERLKMFRDSALHDWSSHGSDALRTFASGYRDPRERSKLTISAVRDNVGSTIAGSMHDRGTGWLGRQ